MLASTGRSGGKSTGLGADKSSSRRPLRVAWKGCVHAASGDRGAPFPQPVRAPKPLWARNLRSLPAGSKPRPHEPGHARSRCGGANAGQASEMSTNQSDSTNQTGSVVPVVVLELIGESETIQGWMGRLADHADEAYPEVLERVKKDYRGRLEGVAGQLAEHRPQLVTKLEDRQGTVGSLRSDRDSHVADLEEARLRHAVGEFSEPQWDSRRTTIEGLLDEVDSKLEVAESAVSELTAALDRIDASGPRRPTVAFTSEGFVQVEHSPVRGGAARNGSWSAILAATRKEGHSDATKKEGRYGATVRTPMAEEVRIPTAEEDGSADSDELDFIDAVSPEDLEELDPIATAMRSRES